MKATSQSVITLLRAPVIRSLVALAALAVVVPAPAIAAANYVVFGQVRQIDPDAAEDDSIAPADLKLGDPLPFTRVAIFDRATDAKLAESWTGANGQFSVSFSAGSPVDVDVRAFLVVDGGLAPLPAAREEINHRTLTSLGATTSVGVPVKVASDLITAAGLASSTLPHTGVGIVFTRVGKVEIPYIEQRFDHTPKEEIGLADMNSAAARARAHELGLPESSVPSVGDAAFEQAPFGDRLLIFGGFGLPGGPAGCTGPIDWYQVTIEQIDESTLPSAAPGIVPDSSFTWADPMSKKRYAVQTFPFVDVTTTDVKIGPFPARIGSIGGPLEKDLYRVNEEPPSTTRQVFYSFPDLRVNWVTNSYNGLYRLKMRYFREVGWAVANEVPIVEEIVQTASPAPPNLCFTESLPPALSGTAAVGELVLRVNNQPLDVRFNHIMAGGTDFILTSNLCSQMELAGGNVDIDFTARHEGGYLRFYSLGATSNNGFRVGFGADENFLTEATLTKWSGTAAGGMSVTNVTAFPQECVYTFDLAAASRVQNGYGYVQGSHLRTSFYVRP